MKLKAKERYDSPSTQVFEVKCQGIICQSGVEGIDPFIIGGDPLQLQLPQTDMLNF